jgi:hypothetical protein
MRTPTRFLLLFCLSLSLFTTTGCETTSNEGPPQWQAFEGTVVYIPRDRGFWGIQARKFGKINPIELPLAFQTKDLEITGEVLLRPDYSSGKKWGKVGEVRNLQILE